MDDGKIQSPRDSTEFIGYTPTMRQFLQIKKENPNLLLLYRMGDFYETFFEDAELVHKVLGLTLTSRAGSKDGEGRRIPMAGIPFTTLDQYLVRLVNQGFSVGICEQVETPGQLYMERKLIRTITPGTLTEANLMGERSESTLLALNFDSKSFDIGFAWMSISAGSFFAMQVEKSDLTNEIERINPSEILVEESRKDHLKELFPERTITALPDWNFDLIKSQKTLLSQFETSTLEGFAIADKPLLITAAGVVCEYAQRTQGTSLDHILGITVETNSEFLGLDSATRRNLELVRTLRGDQTNTLFSALDHCETPMGSRRLLNWITSPSRAQNVACERSKTIELILEDSSLLENLKSSLKDIPDFERISSRIALGSVRPREVAALRDALPRLNEISNLCGSIKTSLGEEISQKIPIPDSLHQLLSLAIKQEPNVYIRDGDVIADGYSNELDELRELRNHGGKFLLELETKEKELTGITTLRVEFNSVHGYFIEVSKGQVDKVPDRYRRKQTLKNVERYTTPELKAFEDKAVSAEERSKSLEKELYEDLIKKISQYCPALLESAKAVSVLDALASLALHANQHRWVRPQFTSSSGLTIKGGRHPVVELAIDNYVPNDCIISPTRRLQIITGPNMGGKSTYMRSIALITLLAYVGSFVPADSAEIGPVDKILTRIGAADDLARGLSTFMVEMTETASILRQATPNSLVLMDEVGRGTSTFDGLSLAVAIAEDLIKNRGCMTLFATHFFELTQLANSIDDVINVHVAALETNKDIVFLHEIREGAANQSYGIAVAKFAGIPRTVIRNAQKILVGLENRAAQTENDQLDLFSETQPTAVEQQEDLASEELQDLKDAINDIDLDDTSPRQAWEALRRLQDIVKGR